MVLSSSQAAVLASVDTGASQDDQTAAYVYSTAGAQLSSVQQIVMSSNDDTTSPGVQLAMDGTTLVAGAPFMGTAFVFLLGSADGDPCATADTCVSGSCVDGVCCTVAACPAASTCNPAETCQPGTGVCSTTPINDGMPCDGGPCTSSATCQDGVCTGDVDICAPPDECHEFGTCDPASNTCFNPAKPDGEPCSGGTCAAGVCVAASGVGGGGGSGTPGGCGCEASGSPPGGALLAGIGILLLARRRLRGSRSLLC